MRESPDRVASLPAAALDGRGGQQRGPEGHQAPALLQDALRRRRPRVPLAGLAQPELPVQGSSVSVHTHAFQYKMVKL